MKIPFLLLICLMLMPAVYAENLYYEGGQYGRVYKWADDYGNVHYTRHPPEYGSYSEINQAPPTRGQVTDEGAGHLISPDAELSANEIIKRNCIIARNNLALLQGVSAKKLTYVNSEGKVVGVDDQEKAARVQAAKNQISLYCK